MSLTRTSRCARLVSVLLALAFAPTAQAARAARTARGAPVRWSGDEVRLRPSWPPPASGATPDELRTALLGAAGAWNDALAGCGVPRLTVAELEPRALPVAADGASVVRMRTGRWCPDGFADETECYGKGRAGITHLRPGEGSLSEADVEVNGVHFRWSPRGERPGTKNLEALFVHELGHVLGLDHSCEARTGCNEAERAAAMYPDPIEEGRAAVLAPTDDEVRTLCAQYGGMPRRSAAWMAVGAMLMAACAAIAVRWSTR